MNQEDLRLRDWAHQRVLQHRQLKGLQERVPRLINPFSLRKEVKLTSWNWKDENSTSQIKPVSGIFFVYDWKG